MLRRCLQGQYVPLFSNALWLEYEDLLQRPVWTSETSHEERIAVLAALAASGRWVKIYYGWRPNLRDPGDDHVMELAVAGGARAIVTHNLRDFRLAELRWPHISLISPAKCLEQFT